MGAVASIQIASVAGGETVSLLEAHVRRGVGILGDRYAARAGYWRDDRVSRDLTLVEEEVANSIGLAAGELRRNVTTRGIRLNELLGSVFWVGDVLCRATELCEPCRHLEEMTGRRLLRQLVHRGGIRARALGDGTISVGDAVEPAEELAGVGVIVRRGERVLLGRRLAPHGYGTWSFPGGKPRDGEPALECALRELFAETGLDARGGRVVAESVDGFPESRLVFRTSFVEVAGVRGEAERREPDQAADWRWWRWSELPSPLFTPVASLVARGYAPSA
jgi:8-oxo-dGTP diphosphatase